MDANQITWATIGPALMGAGAVLVWWLLRVTVTRVDDLEKDFNGLSQRIAREYVDREGIEAIEKRINEDMRELQMQMARHIENSLLGRHRDQVGD